MIKFTAENSEVTAKQVGMMTYCRCTLCNHQWAMTGSIQLKHCPSCKQEGKKDVAMGYVPDWWSKDK